MMGKLKVNNEVDETTAYLTANDMRAANDAIPGIPVSQALSKTWKPIPNRQQAKASVLKDMSVSKFDTRSAMTGDFYDDYEEDHFHLSWVTFRCYNAFELY